MKEAKKRRNLLQIMPQQLAPRPSRCIPGTISTLVYPLIFAILLTVTILWLLTHLIPTKYSPLAMNRFFYLLPSTAESPFSSLKLAICLKAAYGTWRHQGWTECFSSSSCNCRVFRQTSRSSLKPLQGATTSWLEHKHSRSGRSQNV